MQDFTVVERDGKVMGCALLLNLGRSQDGVLVGEVSQAQRAKNGYALSVHTPSIIKGRSKRAPHRESEAPRE